MAKRTSMKDIAAKVGVSTALVSYVLNGLEKEKRISSEVVARVLSAAKELNYKPNQIARSLRKGTTNTIGLVVADISNPFFGQLTRIIEDEAASHGYRVVFGSSDESNIKSKAIIETLLNHQVDGLILTPTEDNEGFIKSLVQKEVPLVLVDRYLPLVSTNYVVLNNYDAVYTAVNYFVRNGYNRISMVAYRSDLVHMQERIRGYEEAMKDHGLSTEIQLNEIRYDHIIKDMEITMNRIITEKKSNALLFATNALSINGLYAIRQADVKVPDELAVIGFDGHEVFDFFQPPLSFIKQPLNEMGKEAVNILINQIKGNKNIVQIKLKHQLIIRESCT